MLVKTLKKTVATLFMLSALLAISCGGSPDSALEPSNGVYYWRTTFKLDPAERLFLSENGVNKMYVRFFDVDLNPDTMSMEKCVPVATIDFADTLPQSVEIVPTVFITPQAIVHYRDFTKNFARRLYAMCDYNHITPNEVQFDCDWTATTRDSFFAFLKEIRASLGEYFEGIRISSTIRLHQLSQTPPPVDEGVLMCYNTGNFRDFRAKNSILDAEDVGPYMKYLKSYDLPLSFALPVYSWNVEFDSHKKFLRLNNGQYDFSDTVVFKALGNNVYLFKEDGEEDIYIRYESVEAEKLLEVKEMLRENRGHNSNIILYHLDLQQIQKYSKDEITDFYH